MYRTVADAELIEAAQRVAPLVRACRDEGERERRGIVASATALLTLPFCEKVRMSVRSRGRQSGLLSICESDPIIPRFLRGLQVISADEISSKPPAQARRRSRRPGSGGPRGPTSWSLVST